MTPRLALADLPAPYRRQAEIALGKDRRRGEGEIVALRASNAVLSKYRNRKIEWQGQIFDSRLELAVYRGLLTQQLRGYIRGVIRQVSLPLLASTRRIRIDFAVVELDGRIRFVDAKGFDTPTGRLKRDQVRQAYGIEIELRRSSGEHP